MYLMETAQRRWRVKRTRGFTLAEVVMAIAVMGMIFAGVLSGYVLSARRAEWSGYSLAAHALAIQQLEQARSAKWDVMDTPAVNEITNLPAVTWAALDLPISGTNAVFATNYVSVTSILTSSNPPVSVQMVQVRTVWPFRGEFFTNTIANYFAPDR